MVLLYNLPDMFVCRSQGVKQLMEYSTLMMINNVIGCSCVKCSRKMGIDVTALGLHILLTL